MTTEQNTTEEQKEIIVVDNEMSLREFFSLCRSNWVWFVVSALIFVCLAALHIIYTHPSYTRTASVLIKNENNDMSAGIAAFADLGLFETHANVDDELVAFRSPALMAKAVELLNLNTSYKKPGKTYRKVAYGKTLPVSVDFCDLPNNASAKFTLAIHKDRTVTFDEFSLNGDKIDADPVSARLLDSVATPIGTLRAVPTQSYVANSSDTLFVSRSSFDVAVQSYLNKLTVQLNEDGSAIIDLIVTDTSVERADDLLNTIIAIYNENWINDKNQIAKKTSEFIDDRLALIERDLSGVDEDISSFKSSNLLPDVEKASTMYLQQSSTNNAQIMALRNQLSMTRYVRDYLDDDANKTQSLPINSGIESSAIEAMIAQYNTKLQERNRLVLSSSDKNPIVVGLDRGLSDMRSSILRSIDNQIVTLQSQIKDLEGSERRNTSRIAANPSQAKYLLSVERQQKVKESLYLYLLQKREENELSQAYSAYNTRVVAPPHGSLLPTAPKSSRLLALALLLAIAIPAILIYARTNFDTKLRSRADFEGMSVPLLGEIPSFDGSHRKLFRRHHKRQANSDAHQVLVKRNARDSINEAFRVLRSNIEFMCENDGSSNVIAITSFNAGSGKTLLALNISTSLAIKNKKVILIDCDLRLAAASKKVGSPSIGFSSYLTGNVTNLDSIIKDTDIDGLRIIPVGTIPPNPTELLHSQRFNQAIAQLKEQCDYLIIDCPPIDIVADTQIITRHVDRTIFVLRAFLFERTQLKDVQAIYDANRFKNMAVVLNGTIADKGRYGRYGKGGYTYGYGNSDDSSNSSDNKGEAKK